LKKLQQTFWKPKTDSLPELKVSGSYMYLPNKTECDIKLPGFQVVQAVLKYIRCFTDLLT
jgi:hypothetical protein